MSTDQPEGPSAVEGVANRPLQDSVRRIGTRLRDDMHHALEILLERSARLTASEDPAARESGQAIAGAATELAARLSQFERPALEILAADLAEHAPIPHPDAATLPGVAAPPAEDVHPAETAGAAGVLPPAETASHVEPAGAPVPRNGRPAGMPGEPPPPAHAVAAATATSAPANSTASPAVIALTDRLRREQEAHATLRRAHEQLQERMTAHERHWREALHELRNAIHAFVSWSFVLRESELKDTTSFAPLVRAAEAVLRRAEETLEPEKPGSSRVSVVSTRVDLVPLAREALDAIRPAADDAGVALSCVLPPGRTALLATADPERVRQILHNLLLNAVAATPRGGSMCVTVWDGGGLPALEVEDTGPGLPPDILQLLTGDEPDQHRHDAIGLRVSRELAQRMGGSLSAAPSRPGAGARIVLRLPPDHP